MKQDKKLREPTPIEEIKEAYSFGKKLTVTPRDGEAVEIHIRPFYTEQALKMVDQLEKVFELAKSMADEAGNIDLFELFKAGREEILVLLAAAIEVDRAWVGRLEIDELLAVFAIAFEQNKDFFQQRVRTALETVVGRVSSIL